MSFKKPSYEKPIINMKKYKDFRVRISQVPPMDVAFQSMALGDYELLVATIYRLNDLIEVTNNYTEKIDEVLEWLLNEGLELAVYLQLMAWKEDGTLGDLINEILFTSKLDKVTFEEFKLEYNDFVDTTNGNINDLLEDMSDFKTDINQDLSEFKADVNQDFSDFKSDIDQDFNDFKGDVDQDLNDFKTNINQDLNAFKNQTNTELAKKLDKNYYIDLLPKDGEFTLGLRIERTAKPLGSEAVGTYFSPQGSCLVDDNHIVVAFMSGVSGDKNGAIAKYNLNTGAKVAEQVSEVYHANGMDYHKDINKIIVAQTNDNAGGHRNSLSVLNPNTLANEHDVTPSGLPSGARVKWFTYDKITKKSYIGDDDYLHEVSVTSNGNMTVVNSKPFDPQYQKYNESIGQNASAHGGLLYYLGMGRQNVAVFDVDDGKLIKIINIPRHNLENDLGYVLGEEPQSINFNSKGETYLTARFGYLGRVDQATKMATYVLRGDFFKGIKGIQNPYTFSETRKTIKVDANTNHPRPNGRQEPFNNLYEAFVFYKHMGHGYDVNIQLENGTYLGFDLNGIKPVNIYGRGDNTIINDLRFNTPGYLYNLKINGTGKYNYALSVGYAVGNVMLQNVSIEGNGRQGIYINKGNIVYSDDSTNIRNCSTGIYLSTSLLLGRPLFSNVTTDVDAKAYSIYTYRDI